MKNEDQSKEFPGESAEEKYKEAGVEGNDQNKAMEEEGKSKEKQVPGHAEKSERGLAEFKADQGEEVEKPDCQTLSENNADPSDRGQTEFLEK